MINNEISRIQFTGHRDQEMVKSLKDAGMNRCHLFFTIQEMLMTEWREIKPYCRMKGLRDRTCRDNEHGYNLLRANTAVRCSLANGGV